MNATLNAGRCEALAARLGLGKPLKVFRWLESRYQQPSRKYHTARHVNECFAALDRSKHAEATNPLVEFAIWFHDAIYNTFSKKNEARSADIAVRLLERTGQPQAERELVRAMILATQHSALPAEPPLQLLVDVDLAILGAHADRYAEFELQIRAEYWWVPTAMYRKRRAAVLDAFVRRPTVSATREFRERLERQARNNLAWGLEQLAFGRATFRWTARF